MIKTKARPTLSQSVDTLSSVAALLGFGGAPCLTPPSLSHCCRFNYRSTHHLTTNGFYEFLNWFDERAWYPLGRIVGGTVSVSYAGCVCVCVCDLGGWGGVVQVGVLSVSAPFFLCAYFSRVTLL